MNLARLHRRLVSAMTLAALFAYAAGGGWTPVVVVAAAVLAGSLVWLPPAHAAARVEQVTRVAVLAFCGWMLYSAVVLGLDFMPGVMAMLLVLLTGEALRPLDARNDSRLYSLSFALLIASTAYYPGPGFAVGFVAYVALTVLAMMVGYLRREAERFGTGGLRVGRRLLWTTAALSLLIMAMSAAVFVLFPRLPRAWNVQGRRGSGGEFAGFSDRVSISEFGGRIGSNPETMLRVEFPDGVPANATSMLLRGRAFDSFDGEAWQRGASYTPDLPPWEYARRWSGTPMRLRVFGGPPGADVIFGPRPVLRVLPRSAIHIYRGRSGDLFFSGTDVPVYTVYTLLGQPSDAQLRTDASSRAADPPESLELPALDARIYRLADSLTAGQPTRIDQVRAVERWLRGNFRYTLDLPRTAEEASLEGFLFERRAGHCEYFSTALAVLLRAHGIPARNVNGFLGGEWNQSAGYLAVTGDHAHSWVEVWFPAWGWVPFDATPPAAALVDNQARDSWLLPTRLWFDGLEYRWYRWVLDYNLDRQLGLFDNVQRFFRQGQQAGGAGRTWALPLRAAAPWLLALLGLTLLWLFSRGRRSAPRPSRASRLYLSLRRAYRRAGWSPPDDAGPLQFAEHLVRENAPGADDAARAVELYLAARFSPDPPAASHDLARIANEAKRTVRRRKRRQPG